MKTQRVTKTREMNLTWTAALFVGLLLSGSSAMACEFRDLATELRDASSDCVLVVAHRGAHGNAPENSLQAINAAVELGVDIIEIDVRFSSDAVPVLMHDDSLDRTTSGSGLVSETPFARLRELRLLTRDGELTDQVIPTLNEALQSAKGRVILDLDIKTGPIDAIVSRVLEADAVDWALFFSGSLAVTQAAFDLNTNLLLMPRARNLEMTRQIVERFQPEVIHIDPSFNSAATTAAAKQSDSRVWINALGAPDVMILTGRTEEALEPQLAFGASIIQTDLPAQVIAYLQATGRR